MRAIHSLLFLSLAACGGGGGSTLDGYPDSTGTADQMKLWAPSASAAAVYWQSITPLFVAGFAQQNNDPCPAVAMNGSTTTYTGGCTDMNGQQWVGSATATAATTTGASGPGHIEYDGFGYTGTADGCTGMPATSIWNGTFDQTVDSTGTNISYSSDVTVDIDTFDKNNSCAHRVDTEGFAYSGTLAVSGPSNMQVQTFDGSGEIGSQSLGKVSASTTSEVVDTNTCQYEALSGSTTITASGHTAVITYDGAASCDQTSTVTWTYDGADQGELAGVGCNAGGGAGAASALFILLAVQKIRRKKS